MQQQNFFFWMDPESLLGRFKSLPYRADLLLQQLSNENECEVTATTAPLSNCIHI